MARASPYLLQGNALIGKEGAALSQATMTTKGQVTVPKAVRDQLDLKAGDRVDFVVNDAGEAVLRRVSCTAAQVQGMLAHRARRPVTVAQMDEAVRRRIRGRRA